MENLPVHVMVDIILRLPVKTIIHCKCVCKNWRNIVFDSHFAHLQLLKSPTGLMIYHNSQKKIKKRKGSHKPGTLKWVEVEDELDHHNLHYDPVMKLDLSLASIFQNSQILSMGSVNGLICLWQYSPKSDDTYICNPITREYMILPRPQYYGQVYESIVYGFGVGSLTQEYKVIRIFREDSRLSEAEVYTIGTGQWRSISHIPYRPNGYYGQFLNGHGHWVDHNSPKKICTFDFDNETFELFPSPPDETIEESRINFQSLGVLNGCLCRCDTYNSEIKIWVMKEYGIKKSWHKEVVIKESIRCDFALLNLLMSQPVYLLEGLKDGTILMVSYEDKLLAYCPRRKTIVNTKIFNRYLNGVAYRPSFHRLHNFENERVHVF